MEALTQEAVIAYAKPLIYKFINQHAADLPQEQKEEIEQTTYVRLLMKFPTIDEEGGWKSYVYNHARGAVLDYIKFGKGFQESRWSLTDNPDEARTPKLFRRVERQSNPEDAEDGFDLDFTLGINGVFSELSQDRVEIKWSLLARLASQDEHLHAFAKYLRGISIEEMAPVFGVVRTRVSQMIQAFVDRFDDPDHADDPWFKQTCYALGVCRQLGMEDIDQSEVMGFAMGWKLSPVDLDFIPDKAQDAQMGLFDEQEEETGAEI